jgi:hypothetical protein
MVENLPHILMNPQTKYEIRGDRIYESGVASIPVWDIRGNKLHQHIMATQAEYVTK